MAVPEGLFKGVTDRFNGVTINSKEESDNNVNFVEKLESIKSIVRGTILFVFICVNLINKS